MKGLALLLLTSMVAPGLSIHAADFTKSMPSNAGEVGSTSVAEYVPMTVDNLNGSRDEGFAGVNVADFITGANPTFWDSDRSFGTPYPVLRTFVNEGLVGAFRTKLINLKGGTYISFLVGGNPHLNNGEPGSFVNIWNNDKGYDAGKHIHNHAFNDPKCAENMTFKYFQVPEDGNYLLYIRDGANGGFGGINFGELRINQTFEEVCQSFSAHKAYYRSACKDGEDANVANTNLAAYNYMMEIYQGSEYTALNEGIANFTSCNEGFERNDGMLGWTIDRYKVIANGTNSVIGFTNVNTVISDAETKYDGAEGYFNVPMPFNKTGNGFFNGEAGHTGLGEPESYRFISHEFKLSSDLVSVKLGGGTAVLDVIDASTHEILATTNDGDNHPNPGFMLGADKDIAGEASRGQNISKTGTRLNTFTTVYLDVHEFNGRQVRLAISDNRTGGDWGLAYFDDIRTDYTSAPSYTLETFVQTVNEDLKYYGVIVPKYVGNTTTDFGEAYSFLQTYYALMRTNSGSTWCSLSSDVITTLYAQYNDLSAGAKAIVDASEDYHHSDGVTYGTSSNFWLLPVVKTSTVGVSLSYAVNYLNTNNVSSLLNSGLFVSKEGSNVGLIIIGLCLSLVAVTILIIKKRKYN